MWYYNPPSGVSAEFCETNPSVAEFCEARTKQQEGRTARGRGGSSSRLESEGFYFASIPLSILTKFSASFSQSAIGPVMVTKKVPASSASMIPPTSM